MSWYTIGMTLDEWLRNTGTKEQVIALEVETSQATINRLRTGKRRPSIDLVIAIKRATGGAVTVADWYPEAL